MESNHNWVLSGKEYETSYYYVCQKCGKYVREDIDGQEKPKDGCTGENVT